MAWANSRPLPVCEAVFEPAQRSALTAGHKKILDALDLPEPPRFLDFTAHTA